MNSRKLAALDVFCFLKAVHVWIHTNGIIIYPRVKRQTNLYLVFEEVKKEGHLLLFSIFGIWIWCRSFCATPCISTVNTEKNQLMQYLHSKPYWTLVLFTILEGFAVGVNAPMQFTLIGAINRGAVCMSAVKLSKSQYIYMSSSMGFKQCNHTRAKNLNLFETYSLWFFSKPFLNISISTNFNFFKSLRYFSILEEE